MNPKVSEWAHLTAFQQQATIAIMRLGGSPGASPDDRPHGLAIKRDLEVIRGEEVNHGRLYPNLDDLVRNGFIDKGERDKRTNTYVATDKAAEALASYLTTFVGIDVHADDVTDYAQDAYDPHP